MREYSVKLPDRPGELANLCESLASAQINILTAAAMTATGAILAIITDDAPGTKSVLDSLGYEYHDEEVLLVTLPHQAGALAGLSRTLANAGINIKSIYIMSKDDDKGVIAFTVDDVEAAREMI
ncbi:MAG: ACT domain-containing protein [Candidatus Poseidoniaceae archaeon]|jgi:hypothetical protein|nr:ACT domain-containing protein [Candidatus Poseidoniaceae archaeon]